MRYDLKHLSTFVAVAEELNFHRAAERLTMAQPAVSRIVLELEERLGVRLLERTTRRLRTTEPGAAYSARCAVIAAQIDEANREALAATAEKGTAHYWSRSRGKLWNKGEESGHTQKVHEIRMDCDEDVVIYQVEQIGGIACHTGRQSCFYRRLEDGQWVSVDPVLKDPTQIYAKR